MSLVWLQNNGYVKTNQQKTQTQMWIRLETKQCPYHEIQHVKQVQILFYNKDVILSMYVINNYTLKIYGSVVISLHAWWILALDADEFPASCFCELPVEKEPQYPLDWTQVRPWAIAGEEPYVLPGIEPRFSHHPVCSLVTILTELQYFWFYKETWMIIVGNAAKSNEWHWG
jgi:hypothetical protein